MGKLKHRLHKTIQEGGLGSRSVPDATRRDPTRPDPTRPDPTRPDQTQASLVFSLYRYYQAVNHFAPFY